MQERFITLFDFCESQKGKNEIVGEAQKELGEIGKIACITESMADEADRTDHVNQFEGDAGSLAASLAVSKVRISCCQCLNGHCQFRREENPALPETKQD